MREHLDGARTGGRRRHGGARPRAPWMVGLVATVALAAGACGNEATQEAAERSPDPVVAAAGKAGDEDTARITFDVSFSAVAATAQGAGTFAMVGDDAEMTLEATEPGRPPETVELLLVVGTGYLRNPEAGAGGPQWFRLPTEGQAVEGLGGAFTDPTEAVGLLDSVVDAQEAGTTDVDGEEATLYRGTVDLAQASGDDQQAGQLAQLGLDRLPVEVAVDGEGRLRRITITADLSGVTGALGGPPEQNPGVMTITIELTEFGVPLEVSEPPAEQVADLPARGTGGAAGVAPPTTAAA